VEIAGKLVREQKAAGYDLLKLQESTSSAVYDAIVKAANKVEVGVRRAIAARQKSIDHMDIDLESLEADDAPIKCADARTRARELPFHVDERKIPELVPLARQAGAWNAPTMALWEVFYNGATGEAIRDGMPEVC